MSLKFETHRKSHSLFYTRHHEYHRARGPAIVWNFHSYTPSTYCDESNYDWYKYGRHVIL
jgi:hypothetical protein